MADSNITAYFAAWALVVGIPIVLLVSAYIVYRIVKERNRRIRRRELERTHPEWYEGFRRTSDS